MSRLPRRLARRIDRLARRAHAFHRFAHHPLCAAYRGELFAPGRRTLVCRGCALAVAGAAAGLAAGLLLPAPPGALLAAGAALFLAGAPLAVRRAPERDRSRSKAATRFAPAALGGALLTGGLRSGAAAGWTAALAAAAGFALAVHLYRRRGPDRAACDACPERDASAICSGFLPLARRERAFRRLAGRWINLDPPR